MHRLRIRPMRAGERSSTAIIQTDVTGRQALHHRGAGDLVARLCACKDQVLFVARIARGDTVITAGIRVGSTVPAVLSCMGEVMPAFTGEDELARTIGEESFAARWGRTRFELGERARPLEAARSDWHLIQPGR